MTNLTVKIDEAVLVETDELVSKLRLERDEYISQAVILLNKIQIRKMLERQLEIESKLVQSESMKILAEFESAEN